MLEVSPKIHPFFSNSLHKLFPSIFHSQST